MIKHIELEVNNKTIRGYLDLPSENPKSLVIMLHGFTGHKVENGFAFRSLSRLLSSQNIASIRMDFSGSGDSDGEFHEFTFFSEVTEARAIIEYAKAITNNISLLGFSLGGAVASVISKEYDGFLHKMLLWAPVGNLNGIAKRIKDSTKITKNGHFDMGGYELSEAFCNEIVGFDVYQGIEQYQGNVMIIHGELDQSVELKYGVKYQELYPNSVMKIIPGANHLFSSVELREELNRLSIEYLKD